MANITLCPCELKGDVPNFKVDSFDKVDDLISDFLTDKKEGDYVYVCFQSWRKADYKNEHNKIVITHSFNVILLDELLWLEDVNINDIDYSIFEFESYEEAFKYCTDLKEGL